jgi:hypothetical protein
MMGKNACGVVHSDRIYGTQKNADYGDRDDSCGKGRDKPNYQLATFFLRVNELSNKQLGWNLQHRQEGIDVNRIIGSNLCITH